MKFRRITILKATWLLLLVYTVFSGVARKWMTRGDAQGNAVFLGNLCLPVLLLTVSRMNYPGYKRLWAACVIYAAVLIGLAFHPLQVSIYHGLSGILVHSIFWLILFVYINDPVAFGPKRFDTLLVVLVAAETALATVQYFSDPDAPINRYAKSQGEQVIALAGTAVRVTGTFSYLGGFTAFSNLTTFITCYYLKKDPSKPVVPVLFFAGIFNCLISGSRGALGFYLLTVSCFIICDTRLYLHRHTLSRSLLLFLLLAAVNGLLGDPAGIRKAFTAGLESFQVRALANQQEGMVRLSGTITEPFTSGFSFKLAGIGLGATYQGANASFGLSPLLDGVAYENELFRLVIEGGFFLVVCRFLLLAYMLSFFRFSRPFKLYLLLIIGIYTPVVFNIYNGILTAFGLCVANQAFNFNTDET